jgi:TPR repeat protein
VIADKVSDAINNAISCLENDDLEGAEVSMEYAIKWMKEDN